MITTTSDFKGVAQIVWTPGVSLEAMEKQIIEAAYGFYRGNKTATAQSLGISIRTLDNKLERYAEERVGEVDRAYEGRSEREKQLHYSRFGRPAEKEPSNGDTSKQGVRSEPAKDAAAQHAVPVSKSKEVQSMLSKPHASSGSRGRG